jgi:beta-phosphoglucomutase-like phosphatase (HAD superfamily)
MNYDLFIFDLDDTILMTEHIHYQVWLSVLKKCVGPDFSMTYNEFCSIFHTSIHGGIERYLNDTLKLNGVEVMKLKNQLYIEKLINNPEEFRLNEGCEELLKDIVAKGKQFVIVTNTRRMIVDNILEQFPILKLSSRTYCREDMIAPKPSHHCFSKVLEDFQCKRPVIFEDSLTGILAARSSPCKDVIFVNKPSYIHYDMIIKNYNPTYVISNFVGLNSYNGDIQQWSNS